MIRVVIGFLIQLLANALGLLAAAWLLEDFKLTAGGFVIAVVLFTVVYAIAQPFFTQMAMSKVPALRGGVALVATLVGLIITALITDGLSISGISTWFLATVVVWVVALLGSLILPPLLIKKKVANSREG